MSQTPTLANLADGFAIADIMAVVITTASAKYLLSTGTKAGCKAVVSAGKEQELRKRNQILALSKTEDIVKGYDVTLTDAKMHSELLALIDGGVRTTSDDAFSYSGPVAGSVVTRTEFEMDIYSGVFGTGGAPTSYIKFSFTGCKGTPCEFEVADDTFFASSYTIRSRPDVGDAPITITTASALPTVSG